MEESLKVKLELHVVGDGRTFLNFWNWMTGEDVIAELIDGKLYQDNVEISLDKFVNDVKNKF